MSDLPKAVPLIELLQCVPADARYTYTETNGVKATHFIPIGRYAQEAVTELTRLRAEVERLLAIINGEFHKRGRIGPDTPDNSCVICPHCTSQFRAISVNDQNTIARLEADARRYRALFDEPQLSGLEAAGITLQRFSVDAPFDKPWFDAAIDAALSAPTGGTET